MDKILLGVLVLMLLLGIRRWVRSIRSETASQFRTGKQNSEDGKQNGEDE